MFFSAFRCLKKDSEEPSKNTIYAEFFNDIKLCIFDSREEQERYAKSMLEYKHIKNYIDTALEDGEIKGREEGFEQGIEQGREQGILTNQISTIEGMLSKGLDWQTITDITNMTQQEFVKAKQT